VLEHSLAQGALQVHFIALRICLEHALVDISELAVKMVGLEIDELVFHVANGDEAFDFADSFVEQAPVDKVGVLVRV